MDQAIFAHPSYRLGINNIFDALYPELSPLSGLRVADIGCGWGDLGKMFAEAGSYVTFIDGREENLWKTISSQGNYAYASICGDVLDESWTIPSEDVALCVGLLYHVDEPNKLIHRVSECAPILVLETICLDHDGIFMVNLEEDTSQVDYSISGGACRPSPGWIKRELGLYYSDVRELNVESVPPAPNRAGEMWQWEFERTCGWRRNESHLRKLYLGTK